MACAAGCMCTSLKNALLCHETTWNGRMSIWEMYVCSGVYLEKGEKIRVNNAKFGQCLRFFAFTVYPRHSLYCSQGQVDSARAVWSPLRYRSSSQSGGTSPRISGCPALYSAMRPHVLLKQPVSWRRSNSLGETRPVVLAAAGPKPCRPVNLATL